MLPLSVYIFANVTIVDTESVIECIVRSLNLKLYGGLKLEWSWNFRIGELELLGKVRIESLDSSSMASVDFGVFCMYKMLARARVSGETYTRA